MFALLLPSRPLLSSEAISPTQYAFSIPSSPPFNHLAIFLVPNTNFPPDTGATIWIQTPTNPTFRLLGALTQDKPSAIYKVNSLGTIPGSAGSGTIHDEGDIMSDITDADSQPQTTSMDGTPPAGQVVIGVQIEPLASVQAQVSQSRTTTATSSNANTTGTSTALVPTSSGSVARPPVATKVLAQRIIQNAFDFLSSFGAGDTVPLKAFQDWWRKFEGRIERDPGFLERSD